jgi:hypothetical protein
MKVAALLLLFALTAHAAWPCSSRTLATAENGINVLAAADETATYYVLYTHGVYELHAVPFGTDTDTIVGALPQSGTIAALVASDPAEVFITVQMLSGGGVANVYAIDKSSGASRLVGTLTGGAMLAADSDQLYSGGYGEIDRLSKRGGATQRIANITPSSIGADDQFLYVIGATPQEETSWLWRIPKDGGAPQRITPASGPLAVSASYVWFQTSASSHAVVVRLDKTTLQTAVIYEHPTECFGAICPTFTALAADDERVIVGVITSPRGCGNGETWLVAGWGSTTIHSGYTIGAVLHGDDAVISTAGCFSLAAPRLDRVCLASLPTIHNVTPHELHAFGSTIVEVTGSNFARDAIVRFGDATITPLARDDSHLVLLLPIDTLASTQLTITNPDGATATTQIVTSALHRRAAR